MQSWRSRVVTIGPFLVSLVLGALTAEECVRASLALRTQRTMASHDVLPPPYPRPAFVDLRAIQSAHLFGVVATESTEDPADAPLSAANLTLLGTLATQDPGRGVAIIGSNSAAKVYSVGEDIEGASLHAVYLDRVTLSRSGKWETLLLRSDLSAANRHMHSPAPVTAAAEPAQPAPPERSIADVMKAEPVGDESDKLLGFRVAPGRSAAALVRAGLRPGDLMTAVNGTPLADQDRTSSQGVVDTMLASGRATITVLRGGKPLEVAVDLAP